MSEEKNEVTTTEEQSVGKKIKGFFKKVKDSLEKFDKQMDEVISRDDFGKKEEAKQTDENDSQPTQENK